MADTDERGLEAGLIEILEELLTELRPRTAGKLRVELDSRLDRDLGLDSLSRVELLVRIRDRLGRELPEMALARAETPRDILAAMTGEPVERPSSGVGPAVFQETEGAPTVKPVEARTVLDILTWHAERRGDRTQILLLDDEGGSSRLSYVSLLEGAERVADGLRERGISPGDAVSIMLPTCPGFFDAFFGILIAGAVPVPMYPPVRPSQIEEHLRRQASILQAARVPLMITVPEAIHLGRFLQSQVPCLRELTTTADLAASGTPGARPGITEDRTAFLQFTSGSTGNPKGVVLTHRNLVVNARSIVTAVDPTGEDVFVSWLPLYHDMGLIGACLGTLYAGVPLVLMSPLRFLLDPSRWLEALTVHRGTLSGGPNFAYELCLKKIPEERVAGFDLSRWRMTLNGAEPVVAETMRRFGERFAPAGFSMEAMQPVYGLAENSVALTSPVFGRTPRVERVDREALTHDGVARPAGADAVDPVEVVGCGPPIVEHEFRVADDEGQALPERQVGRIQFRGPSSTSGYFENPEATAALMVGDGWLDSGDLGYIVDGELYPTGRIKDVIIRAGRNIYPYELEEAVGRLDEVRKGCVAVFAARDRAAGTEKVVVLAETREKGEAVRRSLRERILELSTDVLGSPADEVVLAPPHAVLKTSSGKIRRNACRERYESGKVLDAGDAVWVQLARMGLETAGHLLRRGWARAGDLAWAAWFWGCFAVLLGLSWILVMVLPTRRLRARAGALCARTILLLTGIGLEVNGAEQLEMGGPVVIVSNHTSYADNLVLPWVLPPGTVYTPKAELAGNLFFGPFLRRLGVVFVARFEDARGASTPERMRARLEAGEKLAVFPEGTCVRVPGLLPFRLGAFQVAAETGTPVVPVVLRGVREVLRPDSWFPRRGKIEVRVGLPIAPEGSGWEEALRLRDRAREWILAGCGEPDLEHEDPRRFWS